MAVAVLGAGCFGLSSAIELMHAGYNDVTIVAAARTPRTTSDGAGALWRPQIDKANHQSKTFGVWGALTLTRLVSLMLHYGSEMCGMSWVTGYEFHKQPLPIPFFAALVPGFREMPKSELTMLGLTAEHGFSFTSLIGDMTVYLPLLEREFEALGGRFVHGTVTSLAGPRYTSDSLEADGVIGKASLIVNCLGLGPMTLLNDTLMKPIRGYLVRVHNHSIHHWYRDSDSWSYIFPRRDDVVLGGTYDVGVSDTSVDDAIANDIIAKCSAMVSDLKHSKVINHWIGLRPHREILRLELELPSAGGSEPVVVVGPTIKQCYGADSEWTQGKLVGVDSAQSTIPIIHNYGASGSGMTIHWGCAKDVLALVQHVLPLPSTSTPNRSSSEHGFVYKPPSAATLL